MANPMGGGGGDGGGGGKKPPLREMYKRPQMEQPQDRRRQEQPKDYNSRADSLASANAQKAREKALKTERELDVAIRTENKALQDKIKYQQEIEHNTKRIKNLNERINKLSKSTNKADQEQALELIKTGEEIHKQNEQKIKDQKEYNKQKDIEASKAKTASSRLARETTEANAQAKKSKALRDKVQNKPKTRTGKFAKGARTAVADAMASKGGIGGGIVSAVRDRIEQKKLRILAGERGANGKLTSGAHEARAGIKVGGGIGGMLGRAGQAMTGGGGGGMGGALGNIFSAAGSGAANGGPWAAAGKAAIQTVKELGSVAISADEKMARLGAQYMKSTTDFGKTTADADKIVSNRAKMFRDSYVATLEEAKKFGVGQEEVFGNLSKMIKTIRPMGADAGRVFTDLGKASFQFATAMDVDSGTVTSAIEDNMLRMGKTAEQTRSDLAAIYSEVSKGQSELGKGFANTNLRMDEFSKLIFDSARNADVWSLNYRAVSKELVGIETLATKAGLSVEKRDKLAKSFATYGLSKREDAESYLAGRELTGAGGIASKGKTTEQIEADILKQNEGMSDQQKADVSRVLARRAQYESEDVFGQALQDSLAGTGTAMKSKMKVMRERLKGVEGAAGQEKVLKGFQGFGEGEMDQGGRRATLEILEKMAQREKEGLPIDDLAKEMETLAGPQMDAVGRTEMWQKGMSASLEAMWETQKEILAQEYLGNKLLQLQSGFSGRDEVKEMIDKQEAERQRKKGNLEALETGKVSKETYEIAQKKGIDLKQKKIATGGTGGRYGKIENSMVTPLAEYLQSEEFQKLGGGQQIAALMDDYHITGREGRDAEELARQARKEYKAKKIEKSKAAGEKLAAAAITEVAGEEGEEPASQSDLANQAVGQSLVDGADNLAEVVTDASTQSVKDIIEADKAAMPYSAPPPTMGPSAMSGVGQQSIQQSVSLTGGEITSGTINEKTGEFKGTMEVTGMMSVIVDDKRVAEQLKKSSRSTPQAPTQQ